MLVFQPSKPLLPSVVRPSRAEAAVRESGVSTVGLPAAKLRAVALAGVLSLLGLAFSSLPAAVPLGPEAHHQADTSADGDKAHSRAVNLMVKVQWLSNISLLVDAYSKSNMCRCLGS